MIKNTIQDINVRAAISKLPDLGSTDGDKTDRTAVKLFDPLGSAFWVLWESDAEGDIAFGYCDLGLGFGELGYVSVESDLATIPRIEQDVFVSTIVEGYNSRYVPIPDYVVEVV